MTALKEMKAHQAERLTQALKPWMAFAEIERFAWDGHACIPPEWLNTYFGWWGIDTKGNPDFYNLPRKYEISIRPSVAEMPHETVLTGEPVA